MLCKLFRVAIFTALLSALIPVFVCSSPALALSIGEYFEYDISAEFSETEVHGSETFTAVVGGEATCIKDLPLTVSKAEITGRIVARHRTSGAEVTLNSSYSLTIDPFPNQEGESLESSVSVPLKFPSGSKSGIYDVFGELIKARVFAGVLWLPATDFLPSEEEVGSLIYVADGGGGGGGGGIIVEPDDLSGYIDEDGIFITDVAIESDDGKCWLSIGEDTLGLTKNGSPISEITVAELAEPPLPPEDSLTQVIGRAYDFGPDDATFDSLVVLNLTYDAALLPKGLAEEKLFIAMWDEADEKWVELPSTVDAEKDAVSAEISHFTPFAILAHTRPAQFVASNLVIAPAEVGAGEVVTISVLVTNSGDLLGKDEIALSVNGVEVAAKKVTLAGGASETLTFEVLADTAGTCSVAIAGVSGSFVVKPGEAQPPPTPPSETQPPPSPPQAPPETTVPVKPINWLALGGTIAGVIGIGLLIFILARRKRA
jgi:hypothetical protein